jgi:hypothetical protein
VNEKLRECPFCGEDVNGTEPIRQNDNSTADVIQCCNCGLSMFETTPQGLIKTWNTRALDTPAHETVEECRSPNQPIVFAEDGCIRFMENKIVDRLLDIATESGYSLNEISADQQNGEFRIEDYKQLMQLIGCSVSGYGDLNEVSHEEACKFDEMAEQLAKGKPEIKE